MAERLAHDVPHLGSDWVPRLQKAGFTIEAERTFTINLEPPLPAAVGRYARAALRRMRGGLDERLNAARDSGRAVTLLAIDVDTGHQMASVEVGARPWGVGISPDGTTLFTANGTSNDVSVVDAKSMQVTSRIAVGTSPWGLVVQTVK